MKPQKNIGLLLLLLAVFTWIFLIRGQLKVFGNRALVAKQRSIELSSLDLRIKDLDKIKSSGDTVQSIIRAYNLAMPKLEQIPESLVMIESLGSTAGVVFGAVNVGAPTGGEVPVAVTFSGNLERVSAFLDAVKNNIRSSVITTQTLTAEKNGNLTVAMQLGLVYQGGQ